MTRQTTKDKVRRHIFQGEGDRCVICGYRRAFFLHNAPGTGKDWATE